MTTFDEVVLSPEYLSDPYGYYRVLRDQDPVHWSEPLGAWVLTRYDDSRAAFQNPKLISGERIAAYMRQLPDAYQQEMQPLHTHLAHWTGFMDPPDHTRLRTMINRAFTPRVVEALRPRIQSLVDGLIDRVIAQGEMDLIADLAFPLPATVISELLGVPPEDREQFHTWSNNINNYLGTGRPQVDVARQAQQSVEEISAYFINIAEQRKADPGPDLLSAIVSEEHEGTGLTQAELVGMCVFLLIAGHETTLSLISNGLLALMRHPEVMQRLKDNPALMKTAIEEFLRYDSPLQHQTRVVDEAFTLRGKSLQKGQRVLIMLGAANRDPAQFPDPDQLDIERQPNAHIAFGYGIHFCLGAPLARMEGNIAISSVLNRLPNIQLKGDTLEWRKNLSNRNPTVMRVAF